MSSSWVMLGVAGGVSLAFGGVSGVCSLPSRYVNSGSLSSVVLRSWFVVGDTSGDLSVGGALPRFLGVLSSLPVVVC